MNYAVFAAPAVTLWQSPALTCTQQQQTRTNIADEALYGWPCRVLAQQGDWVQVRTHYGYPGWVQRADLLPQTEAALTARLARPRRVVSAAMADVLSLPCVQGVRLAALPRGAVVELAPAPAQGEWLPVILADGQSGFLRAEALAPLLHREDSVLEEAPVFTAQIRDEAAFRAAVVRHALRYTGTQYRWGGKTPQGIDCSGLVQMCYMLCGVNLYRDAKIMPGWPVHAIDPAQRRPGDLLFFAGHVALLMDQNQYIHCTAHAGSAGVDINSLCPAHPNYRRDLAEGLLAVGSIF